MERPFGQWFERFRSGGRGFHCLTSLVSGRLIPGMNSLLLMIGLPKTSNRNARTEAENCLMKLCQELSPIALRNGNIEEFPPNVWRLTSESGLSFLRIALDRAGSHKFPCRVLPLDGEPSCIEGIPLDDIP